MLITVIPTIVAKPFYSGKHCDPEKKPLVCYVKDFEKRSN